MKKKILFVAASLRTGGIERSLVNLLRCIDYERYEVDLFLYSNTGEYLTDLPQEVKLINKSNILKHAGMTWQESKNSGNMMTILLRYTLALACKLFGSVLVYRGIFACLPSCKGYDVAISFSHNTNARSLYFGFNQFVLSKVEARKKLAWIHSDYIRAGFNNQINNCEYMKFDAIVNVSLAGKDTFDRVLEDLKDRSFVVYNTFPVRKIREQALQIDPYCKWKKIKIVTVCRIDKNKAVDRIVNVCKKLVHEGFDFVWFIVGDGVLRKSVEDQVRKLCLTEKIIFVGNQKNPYPFIKHADLFVLSSKYEGMPMVISEALILKTPVLVTRYEAAGEQIQDKFNGIIIENSEDEFYNAVKQILSDRALLESVKNNLVTTEFTNETALNQLNAILATN